MAQDLVLLRDDPSALASIPPVEMPKVIGRSAAWGAGLAEKGSWPAATSWSGPGATMRAVAPCSDGPHLDHGGRAAIREVAPTGPTG